MRKLFSRRDFRNIKISVSLLFVVWLLYKVHWTEVWLEVQKLDTVYVVAYLALLVFGVAISSAKWSFIARSHRFELPLQRSFSLYLTGMFLNNFFPSTIGGDTYRALQLAQGNDRKPAAFFTVLLDRFTGLVAALVLALAFSFSQFSVLRQSTVWLSAVLLLVGVFVVGVSIWLWGIRLVKMLSVRMGFLQPILYNFRMIFAESFSRELFLGATGYAILFNFVGVGISNYLLFQAIGISLSFVSFASVIFLISIIASIPVSINNIGIKEWAYYTFFGLLGVNVEAAIAVALVGRVLQMLVSFLAFPKAFEWVSTRKA